MGNWGRRVAAGHGAYSESVGSRNRTRHSRRISAAFAVSLLLGLFLAGTAEAGSPAAASSGGLPFNLILRTDQGDGVSTNGYTTGGVVLGLPFSGEPNRYDHGMGFIDVRGHIENDGHTAVTSDLGYRLPDWDGNRIWGVHGGYDWRQTDDGSYAWVNIGAEMLSKDWDLRVDGYINLSSDNILCNCADQFVGQELLLRQTTEESMWGIEGAVGKHFTLFGDMPFYLGGRVHYFSGDFGDPAAGARLQLQADVLPNLSLGASGGYDSLFGALGYATLTFSFGDVPKQQNRDLSLQQRLIDPIQRQELVVVSTQDRTGVPFVDGSGAAVPFIHVDNTAPDGGDGSFEHRFNHLQEAQGASAPGDVIIVHKGDGTTNFYDQGITLQNSQYLLGAQFAGQLLIHGLPICFTGDLQRPTITNTAGDGVTLADNNTVAGLDIVNTTGNGTTTGNGIHGDGITSGTFIDLGIRNTQLSGIKIEDMIGQFTFKQNDIRTTGQAVVGVAPEKRTGAQHFDAVDLDSGTAGSVSILAVNNILDNNQGDAIGFEHNIKDGSTSTVVIMNNEAKGNIEGGFEVTNNGSNTPAAGSNGATVAAIENNDIENNGQEGVGVYSFTNTGTMTALVANNLILNNGQRIPFIIGKFDAPQYAGIGSENNASTINLTIDHNTIDGNLGAGIYSTTSDFAGNSLTHLTVTNNEIDGNGAGMFGLNPANQDADGLVFTVAGSAAMHTGTLFVDITGNNFSGNALHGVFGVTVFNSLGTACSAINNNTGGDDYTLSTVGPYNLDNGVILPNGGGPLNLETPSGNTGTFHLTGVTSVPAGICGF
jgi:hypothetical protein